MRIFLAGCQKNLVPIILSLVNTPNKMVIMDSDRRECEQIADLTDHMVIRGDPTRLEDLSEAHIRNFDLVVALSDSDAENLMICDLAKRHFNVRHSLASVTSPFLETVLERLGVDEALSYPEIAARLAIPAHG